MVLDTKESARKRNDFQNCIFCLVQKHPIVHIFKNVFLNTSIDTQLKVLQKQEYSIHYHHKVCQNYLSSSNPSNMEVEKRHIEMLEMRAMNDQFDTMELILRKQVCKKYTVITSL